MGQKLKTKVNNESEEITRMLNTKFNDIAKHLYPIQMQAQIDVANEWINDSIKNGLTQMWLFH